MLVVSPLLAFNWSVNPTPAEEGLTSDSDSFHTSQYTVPDNNMSSLSISCPFDYSDTQLPGGPLTQSTDSTLQS